MVLNKYISPIFVSKKIYFIEYSSSIIQFQFEFQTYVKSLVYEAINNLKINSLIYEQTSSAGVACPQPRP